MRLLFVNPYYKPDLGGMERIIERPSARFLRRSEVEAAGVFTTRADFPGHWMRGLPEQELVDGCPAENDGPRHGFAMPQSGPDFLRVLPGVSGLRSPVGPSQDRALPS